MDREKYKLPVLNTLYKSIVTISNNSLTLFKALLLPSIIMSLIFIGRKLIYQHLTPLEYKNFMRAMYYLTLQASTSIILGIISAMFAVICHRIVLLGKESLPNYPGINLSRRELKYFGLIFLFGIPMAIGYMAIVFTLPLYINGINFPEDLILLNRVWSIAGLVLITFIIAPFILVLPATAVEEEKPFNKARLTVRGNRIRLAIVILIPALIIYLARLALGHFGREIYNIPFVFFYFLLYFVFMVIQTVVLSVSYKTLACDRENT